MSKTLFMESTKIEVAKTLTEIEYLLSQAGATGIAKDYKDKRPVALYFRLAVGAQEIPFMLPARVEPIFVVLQKRLQPQNRTKRAAQTLEQAERVAWRQILRWTEAQLALIETGMVEAVEVFMPYIQVGEHQTFFSRLKEGGFKLLPATTEAAT